MQSDGRKIRVLVVDDSAVMRKLIPDLLDKDPDIEVVATAIDGDFAISKIEQLKPDVVTLDIDMPRMDGITTLSQIVQKHTIPVVMLSSLTTRGAALTMKALEMGAVDFICKPKGGASGVLEMANELVAKVKQAAESKVMPVTAPPLLRPDRKKRAQSSRTDGTGKIVAIGASSGGPHALRYLLPRIPADFDAGIVIVQHMPESFTAMLARWLDEICELEVREARDGDLAIPGRALIAPGSAHLKVRKRPLGAEAVLTRGELVNGHMPSVDVLFKSVAEQYGGDSIAVIMTGMGSDGALGTGEVKKAGGHTIAQDKDSCAIFGMPKVAITKGFIDHVIPLSEMAAYLVSRVGRTACLEVTGHAES
jgi:two-component system, chemotaxis family, protein-glutamate methylesterase/glutaminase